MTREEFDRLRKRDFENGAVMNEIRRSLSPGLPTPAAEGDEVASRVEFSYRRELWLNHGHSGMYGDDGEMQCWECRQYGVNDYKRAPLRQVEQACGQARLFRGAEQLSTVKRLEAEVAALRERIERQQAQLTRLDETEQEVAALREAMGLVTTIKGDMPVNVHDPVGMAQEVVAYVAALRQQLLSANAYNGALEAEQFAHQRTREGAAKLGIEMQDLRAEVAALKTEVTYADAAEHLLLALGFYGLTGDVRSLKLSTITRALREAAQAEVAALRAQVATMDLQELGGFEVIVGEILSEDQQEKLGIGQTSNVQQAFMRVCVSLDEHEQEVERLTATCQRNIDDQAALVIERDTANMERDAAIQESLQGKCAYCNWGDPGSIGGDGRTVEELQEHIKTCEHHPLPKALATIARLTMDNDILNSALHPEKLKCGHPGQYAYTEDGGKHGVCLLCRNAWLAELEGVAVLLRDSLCLMATFNGLGGVCFCEVRGWLTDQPHTEKCQEKRRALDALTALTQEVG